jgi:predicted TIM-barrel fold metal-dependent hydrolase
MMDEAEIDQAVLSYPTTDAHLKLGSISGVVRIFNDHVAKIIKKYPDRFIGAAILPIDHQPDMLKEIKRATEELGFKAVSLATSYGGVYLDDARFLEVYKIAQSRNLPIFVHAQIVKPIGSERVEDPLLTPVIEYVFDTTICIGKLLMSDILRDYQTKFIFGYFGGVTPFLANRFDATYQMLRGMNFVKDLRAKPTELLKNIYVDTSGDTAKANFQAALELLGPAHILWGSDWPAKRDIAAGINAVKNLDISNEDKHNILGGNLAQILAL